MKHLSDDAFARVVALRRDLHRHPELSGEEAESARRVAAAVAELGLSARTGVGGHGLVVDLPGEVDGPKVALRADMDALPIREETGLPFASVHAGVMHACGHDGHSALLLGALMLLSEGPRPPLPVRLIWQPAEEKGQGARAMIADGVLDGVAAIFGGHLDRLYPPGTLVVTDGPVNASTDVFRVRFVGRGGHGARPHEAVDAILVGSLFVTALQTIVSREVNPAHPAVVSVGTFDAGHAPNVIAGEAVITGTIRAQNGEVRAHLKRSIARIADAVAKIHGATAEVTLKEGTPVLNNRPEATALCRSVAAEVVGASRVLPLNTTNMGGEDFACYLDHVPGCYVRYGARPLGESHPAHSARFDFDEEALGVAARYLARLAHRAGAAIRAGEIA